MEDLIISTYIAGETSLRDVASICGTNHHTVKRVLTKNNIEIVRAKIKPFSKEHKNKISEASKGRKSWMKGQKATPEMIYKNMASHLRFDVTWQWLSQFNDIEKLKLLNECITNRSDRFDVSMKWYQQYIEKFWNCEQFNLIYNRWINSGKDYLKKPSLDHIIPKSKGGNNEVTNLQFLTWFENRCKNDMSQEYWDNVKLNIKEYLI
jgi:5-methylcytosine-specific restriction endonuclease McrA